MQFLLSQSLPESEKCPLAHPPAAPHLLQLLLPSAWTNCKRLLADFRWNYWRIFRASLWFRPIHYKAGMVRHWKSTLLLGIQVDLNLSFDGGLKLCFFGGGGGGGGWFYPLFFVLLVFFQIQRSPSWKRSNFRSVVKICNFWLILKFF